MLLVSFGMLILLLGRLVSDNGIAYRMPSTSIVSPSYAREGSNVRQIELVAFNDEQPHPLDDTVILRQTKDWIVPGRITLARESEVYKRDGKLIWPYRHPKLRNALATVVLGSTLAATWAMVRDAAHQSIVPQTWKNGVRRMLNIPPNSKNGLTPQEEAARQRLEAALPPVVKREEDYEQSSAWHFVRRGFGTVPKMVFGTGIVLAGTTWLHNGLGKHFIHAFDSVKRSPTVQKRCLADDDGPDNCYFSLTGSSDVSTFEQEDNDGSDKLMLLLGGELEEYDEPRLMFSKRELPHVEAAEVRLHRRSKPGKRWPLVNSLDAQAYVSDSHDAIFIRWHSGNVSVYVMSTKDWSPLLSADRVPSISGAQGGSGWTPILGRKAVAKVSYDRRLLVLERSNGERVRFVRLDRTTPVPSTGTTPVHPESSAAVIQQGSWSMPNSNNTATPANTAAAAASSLSGGSIKNGSLPLFSTSYGLRALCALLVSIALFLPALAHPAQNDVQELRKRSPIAPGSVIAPAPASPITSSSTTPAVHSQYHLPVLSSLRFSGQQYNFEPYRGLPAPSAETSKRFEAIGGSDLVGKYGKESQKAEQSRKLAGSSSSEVIPTSDRGTAFPPPMSNVRVPPRKLLQSGSTAGSDRAGGFEPPPPRKSQSQVPRTPTGHDRRDAPEEEMHFVKRFDPTFIDGAQQSPAVNCYFDRFFPCAYPCGPSAAPHPGRQYIDIVLPPSPGDHYGAEVGRQGAKAPEMPALPPDVSEKFSTSRKELERKALISGRTARSFQQKLRNLNGKGKGKRSDGEGEGPLFKEIFKENGTQDQVLAAPFVAGFTEIVSETAHESITLLFIIVALAVVIISGKRQIDYCLWKDEAEEQVMLLSDDEKAERAVSVTRKRKVAYTAYLFVLSALLMAIIKCFERSVQVSPGYVLHVGTSLQGAPLRPNNNPGDDPSSTNGTASHVLGKRLNPPTGLSEKIILGGAGVLMAGAGGLAVTSFHKSQAPLQERSTMIYDGESSLLKREGNAGFAIGAISGLVTTDILLRHEAQKKSLDHSFGLNINPEPRSLASIYE
jgi:hypothetical protein